jgi:deoxyadenosine/deoxycytidine kinase
MENRLTVFVEGNIGSGKSTLLSYFEKIPDIGVVPEPVAVWKDFVGENLLQKLYEDPKTWVFRFQVFVQQTLMDALEKKAAVDPAKVLICERSIFSGR